MKATIDSNIATYLVDAMNGQYDPSLDSNSTLRPERVAIFRIFLYSDSLYATPTVRSEIQKIPDPSKRDTHERLLDFLLDETYGTGSSIASKAKLLQSFHPKSKDCLIVAEAEFGGMNYLITFDSNLLKNLVRHTKVKLIKPTDYWNLLSTPSGTRPRWSPASDNPLALQAWWKLG